MLRIGQLQSSRNAETRDGWNCFASHRERVTQLLLDHAPVADGTAAEGTLCVLGAGNCNDLALDRLLDAFAHIDLVDIDEEAIHSGLLCQAVPTNQLTVRGGIDVTGIAHLLSEWVPEVPATNEQVDACVADVRRTGPLFDTKAYSVSASVCLLSQLVESVVLTLGTNHPRFLEVLTCIRREHLRRLIELAAPGGTVVLITDIVSSFTLPELAAAANSELPMLVGRAIAERNFFSGVNPFVIKQVLETDVPMASQLTDVRLSNPWLWDLGPRQYAVCALTAKRLTYGPFGKYATW